ncbi:hypothetical protein SAMN05421676_105189 [Salinibacillus kushneri]|uniref:Uncharacterized protein n=1 Tax=Salinibacillus kushneri TaxID=237682 RepID=A0A1I0F3Q9_9BACI|nr:hypothetical protein [Salinibacillus kushneri]SET52685.1 hypothetical protein SAMN05421676_105189 [Salinibacillus kushneri]
MDFILFILFVAIGWCVLIGTTGKEKKWIGGAGGLLVIIFIVVSQIIKVQSGFFIERSRDSSIPVGQWVVSSCVVLGIYLLAMINYRLIKAAVRRQSWQRWGLIFADILFTVIYVWAGSIALFVVAFTYFPFAP